MKREERNIYTKCIAVMAVYIIAGVWFYTMPCNAEICPIDGLEESDGKIIEETPIVAETRQIRENTPMSAMPCEDPEAFQKWKETYEQETGEEVEIQQRKESGYAVSIAETYCEVSETETEAIQESVSPTSVVYSVNGETLNPDIQAYLYQRLADQHIEWFMPYSIMIAYQESKFDCYAINPVNKVDCGLFQFRSYYYTGTDIFNPYEQIDIFCELMGNRAKMGCDLYEMISRHMMSDYGGYNAEYVSTVLSHERGLAIIGN